MSIPSFFFFFFSKGSFLFPHKIERVYQSKEALMNCRLYFLCVKPQVKPRGSLNGSNRKLVSSFFFEGVNRIGQANQQTLLACVCCLFLKAKKILFGGGRRAKGRGPIV